MRANGPLQQRWCRIPMGSTCQCGDAVVFRRTLSYSIPRQRRRSWLNYGCWISVIQCSLRLCKDAWISGALLSPWEMMFGKAKKGKYEIWGALAASILCRSNTVEVVKAIRSRKVTRQDNSPLIPRRIPRSTMCVASFARPTPSKLGALLPPCCCDWTSGSLPMPDLDMWKKLR
ncbi:TPA: hypothetical protein N0F65_005634 [Lagenidium giganteum]|uniref:Uncharacterized protein n=1 Tax=Lagenidium giganteum TaxID=4803 RepID=A0AAV2YYA4_9STRA|nr:TPA: hypothetical protein N0F65_005634 [Lagenidium giganteum]